MIIHFKKCDICGAEEDIDLIKFGGKPSSWQKLSNYHNGQYKEYDLCCHKCVSLMLEHLNRISKEV